MTWLHLSDWHQRGEEFDRRVVRDALLADLRRRRQVDRRLAEIDFVFFTGDLAFGGKRNEYTAAREHLLRPVLAALDMPDAWDRVFVVPGNHDLDRDVVTSLLAQLPGQLPTTSLGEWLRPGWQREALLSPFEAFTAFCSSLPSIPAASAASGWTAVVERAGLKVGIAGFNSALLSSHHRHPDGVVDEYGKLRVGEAQVYDPLAGLEKCDLVLALMHHPFEWLNEDDRNAVEDRLLRTCHFILRGPEHRPRISVNSDSRGESIVIPGGASYDRRVATNPRYTNAYNMVVVEPTLRRGTIFFRRWSEQRGAWGEDDDATPSGNFPFLLPKLASLADAPWLPEASTATLSTLATSLKRRPFDSLQVDVALQPCVCIPGSPFVELVVRQRIDVSPGPEEDFGLYTSGDQRAIAIAKRHQIDVPAYTLEFFRVGAVPYDPAAQEDEALFAVRLPEARTTVEYGYQRHLATDGVYLLQTTRYVRSMNIRLRNDHRNLLCLATGVGSNAFKACELRPGDAHDVEPRYSGGVPPHHGYLMQWYPLA